MPPSLIINFPNEPKVSIFTIVLVVVFAIGTMLTIAGSAFNVGVVVSAISEIRTSTLLISPIVV